MATGDTVWGIDVGQCALKALKLRNVEGSLQVEAFDIIEHPRMLSQPEVDRHQLITNALEQFLARNNLTGAKVAIAAPGQSGFTRFVKLPPVETKQVPEIVRFEAEQQIPFNINEVIWRWQDFKDPDSPDIEVGIFAMKRTDVGAALDRFTDAAITVDIVQMAPLALYNFMTFDGQAATDGATLLVDVGADKTELVVSDGPRVWTRTIQLGGNNFTAALVKAFKLSFSKAEKFKRQAATSKYAPQIFKAMQPVFAELVQEISRSIGYYTSLHRDSRFKRVIGLGNGFRLPGLQTFLERNLNIPVIRLDSYTELPASAVVNAPAFTENVLSFAVAYGLAIQGLGLSKIRTSLLPSEIARQRLWKRKNGWFAGAAATILVVLGAAAYMNHSAAGDLAPGRNLQDVNGIAAKYKGYKDEYRTVMTGGVNTVEAEIGKYNAMLDYRGVWPEIQEAISDAVASLAGQSQGQMNAANVDELMKTPRNQRRVFEIESIVPEARDDVSSLKPEDLTGPATPGVTRRSTGGAADPFGMGGYGPMGPGGGPAPPGGRSTPSRSSSSSGSSGTGASSAGGAAAGPAKPGYIITLVGTTPLQDLDAKTFVNSLMTVMKDQTSAKYAEVDVTTGVVVSCGPKEPDNRRSGMSPGAAGMGFGGGSIPGDVGATARNPEFTDPLTGEDTSGDTRFEIKWVFAVNPPKGIQSDTTETGGRK